MLRPGQMAARRKAAFPPSVDEATRLLILGSLPGDVSIRQGEYYAHRGNAFWALMGDVLGEDLRGQPYAMRLKRLKARAVGLWDVIESADREGSLDSAIRGAELRDLSAFVDRLPALEAVAFNGKTAALHGRRQIGARPGLALIDLPSSSGAFASMSREAKRNAWMAMMPYVSGA
ncbi:MULTISPECIES: DNA-deoxyinosine glycosylase [Sphingobium]|jgi:hypoxanthine-DNA glycosylase|uniref:DNA-deoxyinosine glycosylase n=1 Tax=Sphingobium fuliginis (strain ATCC 27551) TaxID=336203 RepID=A0A292ZEG8_SPHSA|nr:MULTISPECIES: DNA-deoxyinosine glycosylase [Sphingobium]AJR25586.1 2-hydroxyacid dehydrogenase [Sphingobium sp. YBL2]MCB4859188.1 DNA-deoxyinosine glycosylase [Sphingobium sp. PNB]QOT72723.1 DNA-deoxyinosine glycosylase [Sphingobium fuliginis]RYL98883.1 DNA-deoxyinosine glycosylase [Sphingobium fuliginis]UXC92119.1 DNA-deoxyinosine glycosylase [Sphingobium sp. RSMS]